MPLAVITINIPSPAMDKSAGEVQIIARAMEIAAQQIRKDGGTSASGTMTDAGITLGTWTYTAVATS